MNGQVISNKSYPTAPKDLEEYAIVVAGAETFLATCAAAAAQWAILLPNAIMLENCYFILGGFPSDGKTVNRIRIMIPLELMSSASYKLVIPSSIFPLAQLNDAERRNILREIVGAEKLRAAIRADNSGIALPGAR